MRTAKEAARAAWADAYRAWGETAKARKATEVALKDALAVEMTAKAWVLELLHAMGAGTGTGTGTGGASR